MVSLSLREERLQTEVNSLKFGFNRFIGSDVDMNYYMGMSFDIFWPFLLSWMLVAFAHP